MVGMVAVVLVSGVWVQYGFCAEWICELYSMFMFTSAIYSGEECNQRYYCGLYLQLQI